MALLKWIGAPGSINFLALCCAAGLAGRAAGYRKVASCWLLIVFLFYLAAGLPFVANALASRLSPFHPLERPSDAEAADAIVVLHGDNVRGRVREAKRLFDSGPPRPVLVSGARDFCERVASAGIPDARITCDSSAWNTLEQVRAIARAVRKGTFRKPAVIASRLQMPRVAAMLRAEHVDAFLAPSAIDDEPPATGIRRSVPTYIGLRVTRDALYELAAIRYYGYQGLLEH